MKPLLVCLLVTAGTAFPLQIPKALQQTLVPVTAFQSQGFKQASTPRTSQLPATQPRASHQHSNPSAVVEVLRYDNNNIGTGNYQFGFEQNDGTKVRAQGELKNEGREDQYIAVRGAFQWIAANGVMYTVTYTADENGYRPHYEQGESSLDRTGGIDPLVLARLLAR